ncbi:hypothetical protein BD309DRAFT_893456, partial [Dichomitus squalens]
MAGLPEVSIHDVGVSTTSLIDHDSALTYNYIVVGGTWYRGGIASRLSEDPTVSVLVLEKGQVADKWTTQIPLLSAIPRSQAF